MVKCLFCGGEDCFSREDYKVFVGSEDKKDLFRSRSQYDCNKCGEVFYWDNKQGFYKTYEVIEEENDES